MALSRTVLMVTCTALALLFREMVHGDDRISHVKKYVKKYWFSEFFEREREAKMASLPQMEATDDDLVVPHQRSLITKLSTDYLGTNSSGICYLIKTSDTQNYVPNPNPDTQSYVSVKHGTLYSTPDHKRAQMFYVFAAGSKYHEDEYYVTVKNEDGSRSYVTPSFGRGRLRGLVGLKLSKVISPVVRFTLKPQHYVEISSKSYTLQYDSLRNGTDTWIDKGMGNAVVLSNDECNHCKRSFWELLDCPIVKDKIQERQTGGLKGGGDK